MRRSPPAPGLLLAGIATPYARPGHAPRARQVGPHPGEPAGPRCTATSGAYPPAPRARNPELPPRTSLGLRCSPELFLRGRAHGHGVPQHPSRVTPPSPTNAPFGTRAKTRGHSGACPGASRHQPRASPSAPSRLPPHRPATLRARLPVTCPLSRPRGAPGPPSGTRHGPGGCSPRASRAVGAQKSKLYVHTHAAVAPWGATRSLTLWSPNPTPKATGTRQSHSHTYLKAQSGRAGLGGGN